jgi:hypothetical protein
VLVLTWILVLSDLPVLLMFFSSPGGFLELAHLNAMSDELRITQRSKYSPIPNLP